MTTTVPPAIAPIVEICVHVYTVVVVRDRNLFENLHRFRKSPVLYTYFFVDREFRKCSIWDDENYMLSRAPELPKLF